MRWIRASVSKVQCSIRKRGSFLGNSSEFARRLRGYGLSLGALAWVPVASPPRAPCRRFVQLFAAGKLQAE